MAFAFGKVILLGEHAVVYGVPAIACGVERGVTACATAMGSGVSRLELQRIEVDANSPLPLGRAFAALLRATGAHAVQVQADSQLPCGAGLGSSAALGVAISRAVISAGGGFDGDRRIALAGAQAWETVFHRSPSGIDAAAALHGGCVRYCKMSGVRRLPMARDLRLVVALSGPRAPTCQMVDRVAALRGRQPRLVRRAFEAIAELTESGAKQLAAGDRGALGETMDRNHDWLRQLSLSTPNIERAVRAAKRAGALGAKLTGAGGGGAVIALVDHDTGPVLASLRALKFPAFATTVRALSDAGQPSPGEAKAQP